MQWLYDGTVNSHRRAPSKANAQWEHLSCAIFAIFDVKKTTEITCDGFLPNIRYFLRMGIYWQFLETVLSRICARPVLVMFYVMVVPILICGACI